MLVSPDGKHIYVVAGSSKTLTLFIRETSDGTVTKGAHISDSTNLDGATSMSMSPDGSNVYVVSKVANTLVHWDRDSTTGDLNNKVSLVFSSQIGNTPDVVVVSPDGSNVYVTAHGSKSIIRFDRNSDTGALTNQVPLVDATNLNGNHGMVASPDGKNIYVSTSNTNKITSFARNRLLTCGEEPFLGCIFATHHLKDNQAAVVCSGGSCDANACCDPNPTCDDTDGAGADFQASSCDADINVLKSACRRFLLFC